MNLAFTLGVIMTPVGLDLVFLGLILMFLRKVLVKHLFVLDEAVLSFYQRLARVVEKRFGAIDNFILAMVCFCLALALPLVMFHFVYGDRWIVQSGIFLELLVVFILLIRFGRSIFRTIIKLKSGDYITNPIRLAWKARVSFLLLPASVMVFVLVKIVTSLIYGGILLSHPYVTLEHMMKLYAELPRPSPRSESGDNVLWASFVLYASGWYFAACIPLRTRAEGIAKRIKGRIKKAQKPDD